MPIRESSGHIFLPELRPCFSQIIGRALFELFKPSSLLIQNDLELSDFFFFGPEITVQFGAPVIRGFQFSNEHSGNVIVALFYSDRQIGLQGVALLSELVTIPDSLPIGCGHLLEFYLLAVNFFFHLS